MKLVFGGLVPGSRVSSKEVVASGNEWSEDTLRKGIGKSESDKDGHATLLPVRKFVNGLLDLCSLVKEVHG